NLNPPFVILCHCAKHHLLLFFPRTNWTMKIISAYTPQHAVVGVSIDPFGIDFSKQRIRRVRERDSATNASLCDKSFNEQSHSRCTVLAEASGASQQPCILSFKRSV